MNINIRPEHPADHRTVENITREAFWNIHSPGCAEHLVIHNLRKAKEFIHELNFVATLDDKVVGSIVYVRTYVYHDDLVHEVITFGPVCVHPDHQNKGIGSKLINHTIQLATEMGFKAIIIGGDPDYYKKYGFIASKHYDISDKDGKFPIALLVKQLYPDALKGITGYFDEGKPYEVNQTELETFDKQFPPKEKGYSPSQDRYKLIDATFLGSRE
jgi:predicted N-acetyltransferase YhbS